MPVSVSYELTALGRSLLAVVAPLKAWAEVNIPQVRAAQEVFDAAVRASASPSASSSN